ncbi:hypothetical protein H4R35_000708 [Dimargaris xerosporica]|nr:hypothetical protein H4R35_000708 [Dimargaris xerosporica]
MSGASGAAAPLDGGQAETLLLNHSAGPQAQVDQWKAQFSVPELRRLLRTIKARVAQKSTNLRDLVGAEYRQVIAAADSIVHINNNACHMASHFESMRDLLTKQKPCLPVAQSPLTPLPDLRSSVVGGTTEPTPNNLAAVAAQIKLLVDIPELIWKALDCNQVLSAAILYLLADKTYRSLEALAISRDVSTDASTVFAQFPLAERQWDLIAHFRARILVRCDELLSSVNDLPLPSTPMQSALLVGTGLPAQALRALCAIALLQNQSLDQLLDHFLACRLTALDTMYHGALTVAADNTVPMLNTIQSSGSPLLFTITDRVTIHPMAHAVLKVLIDTLLLFSPDPHIQKLWSSDAANSPEITQPPSLSRNHRTGLFGRDRANTVGLAQSPPTRLTAAINRPHCVVALMLHCLSTVDKQPSFLRVRSGSMSPALPKGNGCEESNLAWLIRHWGASLFPNLPDVTSVATLPLLAVIQRSLSAPTTKSSRPSIASQHPVSRQPSLGASASRALGGENWSTILARDSYLPMELRLFQPHWRSSNSFAANRMDPLTSTTPSTLLSVKERLQQWLAQLVDQSLVPHTKAWLQHQATGQLVTLLATPFWDRAALPDDPKQVQPDLQTSCVQILDSYLQTHQNVAFPQSSAVALSDALWAMLSISVLPLVDQVITAAVVDSTYRNELEAHNRQFITLIQAAGQWLKRHRRIQRQIQGLLSLDTVLSVSTLPDQLLTAYAGAIQQTKLLPASEAPTVTDLDAKMQAIISNANALVMPTPSTNPLVLPPIPANIQDALVALERLVNLQRLDSATLQACLLSKPLRTSHRHHMALFLQNSEHLRAQYAGAVAPVASWVAGWFLHRWRSAADHAYQRPVDGAENAVTTITKDPAPSPFVTQVVVRWYELMAHLGAKGWLLPLGTHAIAQTTQLALFLGIQGLICVKPGSPKAEPMTTSALNELVDPSLTSPTRLLPDQLGTWLAQAPWALTGLTFETVRWRQLLIDFNFVKYCLEQSGLGGSSLINIRPEVDNSPSQAIVALGSTCAQQLWARVRDDNALATSASVSDTLDQSRVDQICTTTFNQLRHLLVAIHPH